jgi:hypothetical protein
MAFNPRKKQEIMAALNAAGVKMICPSCGIGDFGLLDGFMNHTISDDPETVTLGGRYVPTVVLVCANCGYLSEHAAASLGIIPSFNKGVERDERTTGSSISTKSEGA